MSSSDFYVVPIAASSLGARERMRFRLRFSHAGIGEALAFASAKVRDQSRDSSRGAKAVLPPHKCGDSHHQFGQVCLSSTHRRAILSHRGLSPVRTNIEIGDQLLSEAMRSSGARTKKAAVEAGLRLLGENTIPVSNSSTPR